MDELEVQEIINGIDNVTMRDYKPALLQCLVNKVADGLENFPDSDAKTIISMSLNGILVEKKSDVIDLHLILLSNLTVPAQKCELFMDIVEGDEKLYSAFRSTIDNFLLNNPQLEENIEDAADWVTADPLQYTANLLCNLCQCTRGRKVLLNKTYGYTNKLAIQIRSKNVTRRRGAVSCIRSLLFDKDDHWWMLYEVNVLSHILMPIVDPTPFTEKEKEGMDPVLWLQAENPDKKVEPEQDILKMLIECLQLLCQRRGIREELRKRRVYYVIRNMDSKSEVEEINSAVYEVVNLLICDEDPSIPVDTYQNQTVDETEGKQVATADPVMESDLEMVD